jgi:hypothetical protein
LWREAAKELNVPVSDIPTDTLADSSVGNHRYLANQPAD